MNPTGSIADSLLFTHEAMNTTFALRLRGVNAIEARAMVRECFEQLDAMESRLSRFVDASDVSLINRMQAGETLYLSETCHQCLLLGMEAWRMTGGLFDITLGRRIAHRKSGDEGPLPPVIGKLTIHPDVAAVTCDEPGREIDLGGLGKGYALDQLRLLLADWGMEDALLAAGASSLLAVGPQGWPVELAGDSGSVPVVLTGQSLSASGTGIQGAHIVHPGGPDAMPFSPCRRLWVTAATAALAEIWSTALMLVEPEEIPDFLAGNPDVTRVHIERHGRVESIPLPPIG